MRAIFANKGFEGEDLKLAVNTINSDRKLWIDTMLVDEFGIALEGPSAIKAAFTTFVAFCIVGLMPLLAFIYGAFVPVPASTLYLVSAVITAVAFFLVGAAKSMFVEQRWYTSGLETLLVGGIAASLAYVIGAALKGLVAA